MRRYLPWAGLACAALLGGLALWLPDLQTAARKPAPAAAAPRPAPVAAPPIAVPHTVGTGAARAEPAARPALPDKNGPFPADPGGINAALLARVGEIGPCWETWRAAHPDGPTRPVLAVALAANGDTGTLAAARLAAGDGGDFDSCVQKSLADATFSAPSAALVTLMIPIPLPAAE